MERYFTSHPVLGPGKRFRRMDQGFVVGGLRIRAQLAVLSNLKVCRPPGIKPLLTRPKV